MKTPRFHVRPCWFQIGAVTVTDRAPVHPRADTVCHFTGRPTILRRALRIAEQDRGSLTEAIWTAEARQKEWHRKRWNRTRELHRRRALADFYA